MVLPLPSVTMLPLTPEPAGTAGAAGAEPALKVMVLPLTVSVSPSVGAALADRPVAGAAPAEQGDGAGERRGAVTGRAAMPTSEAEVPPSVIAEVTAVVPPAAPLIDDVAGRGRAGVGGGAAQVGRGGAGDRGGDVRLGGVADRGLQRLVGDRLRGVDQLLQRGDAGVGGLQHLHAVADTVEEVVDVAGARIERLRGEEVGGVIERRVDLLAGGKAVLRGREQIGGRLQREQVLANRRRENNT